MRARSATAPPDVPQPPFVGVAAPPAGSRSIAVAVVFALTLALSAFLLFTVELIVAKAVLPTFGGVPMVWNTCMAFFQAALLAGYFYAHATIARVGTRRHVLVYAVLVALPLLTLPFPTHVTSVAGAVANPIGRLIVLLVAWIGLPFFVLSTAAVVLQKCFAATRAAGSSDPYFLYASSNFGSFLALAAYPTVIERLLTLREQSRVWALCYGAFVVGVWVCGVLTIFRSTPADATPRTADAGDERGAAAPVRITGRQRVRWVVLAFVPSSLMLAVTTYLSTDIAAVPLLWTIPLSLYLLTFVVVFGSRTISVTAFADRALPLLAIPLALLMIVPQPAALWMSMPAHLLTFTVAALLCHGQLADDRPSPELLTEFYLWIALGGMLGGLFNTLAAPVIFRTVLEYPLVLGIACLLRIGAPAETRGPVAMDIVIPVTMGVMTAATIVGLRAISIDSRLAFFVLAIPGFLSFGQSRRHPIRFAASIGAILAAGLTFGGGGDRTLYTERTFYGVYRVGLEYDRAYRALFNGTTLHGMQAIDPSRQGEPLSYYHRSGPLGDVMQALQTPSRATDVAVVGLGVGGVSAYVSPWQHWTFFELDPAVERLARDGRYFTYLQNCRSRCGVVLGDARISLAQAGDRRFDFILLDAFSSDAIPIHLVTSEAFALYLSRLREGGVLAVHISNRHLALSPVIAQLVARHGLTAVERADTAVTPSDLLRGKTPSDWVVIGRRREDLGPLASSPGWVPPVASPSTPLWTDDYSSIVSVLRVR